jgi:tetratricopeptide (TPR) repeat protein
VRDELRRLHRDAGAPSLSQLKDHADRQGYTISRAALADLLNGKGRPRLSTVEAFVGACARFARTHRPPIRLASDSVDHEIWRARYFATYEDGGVRGTAPAAGTAIVPRQLPAAVPRLTGRRPELDELNRLLKEVTSLATGSAAIVVISGTAGVGKTSLAVWWARHTGDAFPDGHLYVDLRGFNPSAPPIAPEEALRGFLEAFGISPDRIPASLPARSGLYRSLLSGRRVLVLLDNAKDADQVRPLLPASAGSFAVVTSRADLTGLVAIEGARLETLDTLSESEARQLLRHRLGDDRVAAEPDAVNQIIECCAGLPLALAVVAARATPRTALSLSTLADELRDSERELDAFATGDDALTDVRRVLSWSYRTLDASAARLFRLMSLHPGPDLDVRAAASLAGVTVDEAAACLNELAGAHLVSERSPDRYDFHDLLRVYAGELVVADGEEGRRSAIRRLVNHYLAIAHPANRLLDPNRDDRVRLAEYEPSVNADPPSDATQARRWFKVEHRGLVAIVDLAADAGMDAYAWQLAWALTTFLDREGHWGDWTATMTTALGAATRLGDRAGQAIAHRMLAHACLALGRLDEASAHLRQALRLFRELGDTMSEAATHNSMGGICDEQGQHEEALEHSTQALRLFEAAGDRVGQANAYNSIGWCQAQLGRYDPALASCERARQLSEELGDDFRQATVWDSLGYIHHQMGHHGRAVECYGRALTHFRSSPDRFYESMVLSHLGECHRELGQVDAARRTWTEAYVILDDLDHAEADGVREKLRGLGPA